MLTRPTVRRLPIRGSSPDAAGRGYGGAARASGAGWRRTISTGDQAAARPPGAPVGRCAARKTPLSRPPWVDHPAIRHHGFATLQSSILPRAPRPPAPPLALMPMPAHHHSIRRRHRGVKLLRHPCRVDRLQPGHISIDKPWLRLERLSAGPSDAGLVHQHMWMDKPWRRTALWLLRRNDKQRVVNWFPRHGAVLRLRRLHTAPCPGEGRGL